MHISERVQYIKPSATLKISAMADKLKQKGIDIIGFGAGEPDFDTPDYIKNAAKEALDNGYTKYTPSSGLADLRKAICANYERKYGLKYESNQIVVSSGAKQSLFNTFQAIINPGDEVIIQSPYWLTYPELIKMAGGVPVVLETKAENGFKMTADEVEALVTERTVALLINNPSNPSGIVYTVDELTALAEAAKKHDLIIISDEIYDDLVYTDEGIVSVASLSEDAYSRTIIINGMSKSYAMTGWRIGYTLSPEAVAKAMGDYQSHSASNPCSIAQYASIAALTGPQEFVSSLREVFGKRRDLICGLMDEIPGINYIHPDGAFYLFADVSGLYGKKCGDQVITSGLSFAEILLSNANVAVVPGASFGMESYIRLSYATSEDNIRGGLERIAKFVSELK